MAPEGAERIVCEGHPRDMGLAQGRQLRDVIAAQVARAGLPTRRSRWPSLRGVVSGPFRGRGAGRELFRHFAHQAERLEGLAQGADLPLDSLLELQLRMGSGGGGGGARSDPGREGDGEGEGERGAWIVRESRPVVGFRSLELTRPWLVPAVVGVNEAGLAVIARRSEDGAGSGVRANAAAQGRAGDAPAILLVQDCLARFEHLAGAVDWCRKRPVEGRSTILLGDASGARAMVEFRGRERLVESRPAHAAMEWDAGFVRIDPGARCLRLHGEGAPNTAGPREFGFPPLAPKEARGH